MVAADPVGPAVLHTPVMAEQVVEMMVNPRASGTASSAAQRRVFVDGTVGHGGHAEALLRADAGCAVLCIDADAAALATAKGRLAAAGFSEDGGRVSFYRGSYAELGSALAAAGRAGFAGSSASSEPLLADGVLLDLGLGSHQLDAAHRGFSFQRDGPLDMRIAATGAAPASGAAAPSAATAADIVSSWSAAQLTELLVVYGEEAPERAAAVAKAIVHWRGKGDRLHRRITSTLELRFALEQGLAAVDGTPLEGTGGKLATKAVRWASRRRREKDLDAMERQRPRYPAETRTLFQALRIAVNAELAQLAGVLAAVPRHLAPGGRLVTLAFQPQEDAAIMAALNTLTTPGLCPSAAGTAALLLPTGAAASSSAGGCPCGACGGAPFSAPVPADAPLRASALEVRANPRARSARLRVLQRDCTCYGSAAAAGAGEAAGSSAAAAAGAAWLGEVEGALRSAVGAVLPAALKAGAARPKKAAGERVRSAPAAARSRAAAPAAAASAEVPAAAAAAEGRSRVLPTPAAAAAAFAAPADDVSDADLEAAIAASLAHGRRGASASAALGRGRAGAGLLMAPPAAAGGLGASVRLLHTSAAPAQQRRGGETPVASQEEEESALAVDASAAALSEAEALGRGAAARSTREVEAEASESDGEAAPRQTRAAAAASEGGEDEEDEDASAREEIAELLAKAGFDLDEIEGLAGEGEKGQEGEGGEGEGAAKANPDAPFVRYADGVDAPFMPPHPAQLLPLPPLRGFAGAPRLPALLPGVSAGLVEKLNFREDKPATLAAGHVVYAGKAAALNAGAAAVPLFDPASSVEALSAINPSAAATAGVHFGIDTLNRIGESVNFGVGREGRLAIAATIDRRLRAQSARRKATVLRLLRDQVMERGGISRQQGGRLTREQATSLAAFIWANEHKETDRAVAYVHPHRPASVAAAAQVPPAVPAMPPPSSASAAGLVAGAGAKVPALLSAFEERSAEIREATKAARRRLGMQRRAAEWSARQRARWAERNNEELR